MEQVKTVGIRKLKDGLSAYLRDVKSGTVILITEHGHIIAEIRTPTAEYEQLDRLRLKQEWIDSDKLILPTKSIRQLKTSPVQAPTGTAERLLGADRGDL